MPMLRLKSEPQGIALAQGAPLLELDERSPGLLSFGCRAGACGACAIRVIEGTDNISKRDEDEARALELFGYSGEEYRLACQCRLLGDTVIEPA